MHLTRRRLLEAGTIGIVLGCGIDIRAFAAQPGNDIVDAPLSKADLALIEAVADTLIPRTHTASASDAGVTEFIHWIYRRGMTPSAREAFVSGARCFVSDSRSRIRNDFDRAFPEQRLAYIETLDSALFTPHGSDVDRRILDFFATIKRLTVIGYYTSKTGANAELDVELFPGQFFGSKPVTAATRTFYEDSFGAPLERPIGYLSPHV